MNPNKDRGARAERELAATLTDLLGVKVDRRRNLGTHADIGDLLIPDTTIQVTACRDTPTELTTRARKKLADVEKQRATQGARHSAVAIRVDGAGWRIVIDDTQAALLDVWNSRPAPDVTLGHVIRWGPVFTPAWWTIHDGIWVGTVELWAESWRATNVTAAAVV